MIKDITITGVKYELNATTKKYVERKIGSLGKYLPRHARKSASADVKIRQIDNVPDKKIVAKDSTMNVLAAVDIVEARLNGQVRKYKDDVLAHVGGSRGILAKLKQTFGRK